MRVLYVATSPSHKRVLEAFTPHPKLDQLAVLSATHKNDNFKIGKQYYKSQKELQKIVNDFKPDVYAQASLPCPGKIKLDKKCKKVYISHGLVGNHVKDLIKPANLQTDVWKGLDLYCGGWDDIFTNWVTHTAKVKSNQILLNALPQLDILYGGIEPINKRPSIIFFGFAAKQRIDFIKHNEDYFRTAVSLSQLEGFEIYIKPRQEKKKLMDYFHIHKLPELKQQYEKTYNNSHVHYIPPMNTHVLNYYSADIFIINGCSTVEIEACAMQKPLIVVRTKENSKHGYDPYDTVKSGAAIEITNLNELEEVINNIDKYHKPEKQKALLDKMGITFDGQHHRRIQERILQL